MNIILLLDILDIIDFIFVLKSKERHDTVLHCFQEEKKLHKLKVICKKFTKAYYDKLHQKFIYDSHQIRVVCCSFYTDT